MTRRDKHALHYAVEFCGESTECIQALLDAGAHKEARTRKYGDTPLALACRLNKGERCYTAN